MNIYDILKKLEIIYQEVEHEPIFNCLEAQHINNKIDGTGCKNLFLTDNKKYYLVILEESKRLNIKEISKQMNTSHLSFASLKELKDVLNLEMGSVTPFGIINDIENKTLIILDSNLKGNYILIHPLVNTKTLSIYYDDLIKFINYLSHQYICM